MSDNSKSRSFKPAVQQDPKQVLVEKANTLHEQLKSLRASPSIERMPIYEADVETDLRIVFNDLLALEGKPPAYFTI